MGGGEGTKVEGFEICMEHGGRPFEGGILEGEALEAGHGMWRCRIPVRQPWPVGVIRRLGARHLKLFQEGCLAWGWLLENRQDTKQGPRTINGFEGTHGGEVLVEAKDKSLPAMHLLDEVEYGNVTPMHAGAGGICLGGPLVGGARGSGPTIRHGRRRRKDDGGMCGGKDGDACRRCVNGLYDEIMSGNTIVSRYGYTPSRGTRRGRRRPPSSGEGGILILWGGYTEEYLNVEGYRGP